MKKLLSVLLGFMISWGVMYTPILHAANFNGTVDGSTQANCNSENESDVSCCFAHNADEGLVILSSEVKTRDSLAKMVHDSVNFSYNPDLYCPPRAHYSKNSPPVDVSTMLVGTTIKLE